MWTRYVFWSLYVLLLLSIVNVAFAQDTNATNETNVTTTTLPPINFTEERPGLLTIQVTAYIGNVSEIWCQDNLRVELLGGEAICNWLKEEHQCFCAVRLPDNKRPAEFMSFDQFEKRLSETLGIKEQEISDLYLIVEVFISCFVIFVIGQIFIGNVLPYVRMRLR